MMKKTNKKQNRYMPIYIVGGTFLGFLLGSLLLYLAKGEFRYDGLIVAGGTSVTLLLIFFLKQKSKKHNIPDVDERVRNNMLKLFFYTSLIFIAILFIAISLFTIYGQDSIPITYLWIYFTLYILTTSVGSLFVKNM